MDNRINLSSRGGGGHSNELKGKYIYIYIFIFMKTYMSRLNNITKLNNYIKLNDKTIVNLYFTYFLIWRDRITIYLKCIK